MDDKQRVLLKQFLEAFENVFDGDWNYTKVMLGIIEETTEQRENSKKSGIDAIYTISPDGTFLNPLVVMN